MKLSTPSRLNLTENKPLRELCTLGIGGSAAYYIEVKTTLELIDAIQFCKAEKIKFFILGKGSNCLFDDRGLKACVIHNKIDFLSSHEGVYHVGAGYSFSRLGTHSAREGFSGLEFASGIPASVGGAVFMNAGANGLETKDFLVSVDFVDEEGNLKTYSKEELVFSYRYSSFQDFKGAIASATFSLVPSKTAREKQIEIIHTRQKSQPYGEQSAGCIFRNPEGMFAGRLIDECGLKGIAVGDAEVSTMHANFLINKETASSEDFKKLIAFVKKTVKEKAGVELESEVRIIPYEL